MLNQKIKPISAGGIPGYNRVINQLIEAVNWLQGIRTTNGQPIKESATGPVIDLGPADRTPSNGTSDGTESGAWLTTPAGETAAWYQVTVLSSDRTTVSQLWVWAGQPRNPQPCS